MACNIQINGLIIIWMFVKCNAVACIDTPIITLDEECFYFWNIIFIQNTYISLIDCHFQGMLGPWMSSFKIDLPIFCNPWVDKQNFPCAFQFHPRDQLDLMTWWTMQGLCIHKVNTMGAFLVYELPSFWAEHPQLFQLIFYISRKIFFSENWWYQLILCENSSRISKEW